MDIIRLNNMTFHSPPGHYHAARVLGQDFEVDVELECDFSRAIQSDQLKDAINYKNVFSHIEWLFQTYKFALLESIAERITWEILTHFPVYAVRTRIRKKPLSRQQPFDNIEIETYRKALGTQQSYIALGSNVEPRLSWLQQAVDALDTFGNIEKVAPVYETAPYGIENQPPFLNSALILSTGASPFELLKQLKGIEQQIGRQNRYRWGPREIDLDIIFYGKDTICQSDLVIPHSDYRNRWFVLQPLSDIAPDYVPPDAGESIRDILARCREGADMKLFKDNWT